MRSPAAAFGWMAGLVMLGFIASGCSSFDPRVGPSQESCGAEALSSTTSTTTGYAGTTSVGATPTICVADAGSACDDCESRWCCATRLPCYEDPVCACKDQALDTCVAAAGSDTSAVGACWNAFTSAGTVEAARVACEIEWCQAACEIP